MADAWGAAGAAFGGGIGGALAMGGTAMSNAAAKKAARRQRAFVERMSNTAYQRAFADMEKRASIQYSHINKEARALHHHKPHKSTTSGNPPIRRSPEPRSGSTQHGSSRKSIIWKPTKGKSVAGTIQALTQAELNDTTAREVSSRIPWRQELTTHEQRKRYHTNLQARETKSRLPRAEAKAKFDSTWIGQKANQLRHIVDIMQGKSNQGNPNWMPGYDYRNARDAKRDMENWFEKKGRKRK